MKTSNLTLGSLVISLVSAVAVGEHQESRVLTWPALTEQKLIRSGDVVPGRGQEWQCLRIQNESSGTKTFPILVLKGLSATASQYAIQGQVRYEGVTGVSYLEMWTVLEDGGRYFTRTLGTSGPLGAITGTSTWRPFALPFDLNKARPSQVSLEVNLVLRGPGVVEIGPLQLVNLSPDGRSRAWWSSQTAGWLGGGLGALIGLAMALAGVLAGRDAARPVVMGILAGVFAVGLAGLSVGVVAAFSSQPYAVCYPLLLLGSIATVLAVVLRLKLSRHWRAVELRKMQAMDAA